jgi:hypothetical protein
MDPLSAGWQAALYIIAVVLFLASAVDVAIRRVNLLALGLAVAFVPLAWNNLAVA